MQAVARAGDRLVAVGQRGHVVVSTRRRQDVEAVDGAGQLGPDGGVLRRRQGRLGGRPRRRRPAHGDGGDSWQLQLDGRKANDLLVERDGAQGRGRARVRRARRRCSPKRSATRSRAPTSRSSTSGSPMRRNGYVVGAYNLIFRTADGGQDVGAVVRPDRQSQILQSVFDPPGRQEISTSPARAGSCSSSTPRRSASRRSRFPTRAASSASPAAGNAVLAFGLRGNVYRSDDGGAAWTKVDAGLPAAIVGAARRRRRCDRCWPTQAVASRRAATADAPSRRSPSSQPMPARRLRRPR